MDARSVYFTDLHRREEHLKQELKKIQTAIQAGQEICEHKYKHIGNDSHYDYEECEICKHRIKI